MCFFFFGRLLSSLFFRLGGRLFLLYLGSFFSSGLLLDLFDLYILSFCLGLLLWGLFLDNRLGDLNDWWDVLLDISVLLKDLE